MQAKSNIWLLHNVAETHLEESKVEEAREIWQKIACELPLFAPARNGLLRTMMKRGKFDEARTEASQMCSHRVLRPIAKIALSEIAIHENNLTVAQLHLEEAYRYAPDSADVLHEMCKFFFRFGPAVEAEASLKEYIRRHPNDDIGYCNLGTLQIRENLTSQAIASYRKALELNRNNEIAKQNLEHLHVA